MSFTDYSSLGLNLPSVGGGSGMGTAFGLGALGAGALGVAGLVDPNLFGGNYMQYVPGGAQLPTYSYDPSQIQPTQTSMLSGIGGLGQYNVYGQLLPQAQGIGQGMVTDPTAGYYSMAAAAGQPMGFGAATNAYGAGGNILQQAFDPQQALYNRLYSQTTDAARANEMAAGLGTSPAGAYATTQAQSDFNINWQNAQLQRMIQGGQAGVGLQQGAYPSWLQAAAAPWQVGQTIGGANLGTLGTLGQFGQGASGIPQQQISDWSSAIGTMGGLQQQAFNQAQAGWQDQMQRAQLQMQAAQQQAQQQGSALGGLGNLAGSLGMMAMFA